MEKPAVKHQNHIDGLSCQLERIKVVTAMTYELADACENLEYAETMIGTVVEGYFNPMKNDPKHLFFVVNTPRKQR